MSNSVYVFVYLLFVLNLSSENHYRDHILCLCSRLNNSLCVGCVVIIPAFALLRFLELLMQIALNTVQQFFAHFLTDYYMLLFFVYHVLLQPKFKFISTALIR